MAKHNTVMSILDRDHGVDTAVIIIDPSDGSTAGKFIVTHVGQTDWWTLWDYTEAGQRMEGFGTINLTYQTQSGKWCSKYEMVEGMTFAGRTFKSGEWLDVLGEDGYQVIEVI